MKITGNFLNFFLERIHHLVISGIENTDLIFPEVESLSHYALDKQYLFWIANFSKAYQKVATIHMTITAEPALQRIALKSSSQNIIVSFLQEIFNETGLWSQSHNNGFACLDA